jgi:hypothetical protein
MTTSPGDDDDDDVVDDAILSRRPLDPNNRISSNPSVPSVSASAVLGESESVREDEGKIKVDAIVYIMDDVFAM